jgi:hypothetical protein
MQSPPSNAALSPGTHIEILDFGVSKVGQSPWEVDISAGKREG